MYFENWEIMKWTTQESYQYTDTTLVAFENKYISLPH